MKSFFRATWKLLKETAIEWDKDNAPRLGAALSYYTVFSLAPLLVVALAIAGLVFGKEAVQGELFLQLKGLLGEQSAKTIETLIANAWKPESNVFAAAVGILTLIIGGTAVFTELRAVLNQVWDVVPQKLSGVLAYLKNRLLSFAMIAAIGFLLLISLLVNTALAAISAYFSDRIPLPGFAWQFMYALASYLMIALLFAAIFKVLPDEKIAWRDVWVGACITSFLFAIGKFLIGLYLGKTSFGSAYGASGSLVIIMLWAYYSSLIVIFGAEFTQVFSKYFGSRRVAPAKWAAPVRIR